MTLLTMKKKTIKDIPDLSRKRVFLTADFNISLDNGEVANDTRIRETLPTIDYLLGKKAKIIIASHLGRPKGKVDPHLSLAPVAERLSNLTKRKVHLIPEFWKEESLDLIKTIPDNEIVLLENIRFCIGEQENEREFSKHLSKMADLFVNDAFGASHRVHASTVGITQFLKGYAGLLLDKEVTMLSEALENPKRPMTVIIGGAKTPDKIQVIDNILDIADNVLLGGAIANTFLAAWGFGMGQSMVDYEMVEMARVVFWKATRKHSALMLPHDVIVSDPKRKKKPQIASYQEIPHHSAIFDIGPKALAHYIEQINNSKTIIWNGPMGLYEDPRFKKGTDALLQAMSEKEGALTIIGGGDTLTSIHSKKYADKISHISTGGGAMLEFMEKGTLPGIEVLEDK